MFIAIRPAELAARLRAGEPTVLVDVRQPWEHELARLPGSVLLPLGELPARAGEIVAPEDALVVAYCHHGVRSQSGAAILLGHGLRHVASLVGGIEAWSAEVDPGIQRY
ncbi:MAG TPA: rhodanese-like domain-containing protein [Vulgatibacter sp.]|nr:rhodanese-like domain-containing protein [Vulgatibacter sp.]